MEKYNQPERKSPPAVRLLTNIAGFALDKFGLMLDGDRLHADLNQALVDIDAEFTEEGASRFARYSEAQKEKELAEATQKLVFGKEFWDIANYLLAEDSLIDLLSKTEPLVVIPDDRSHLN